MRRAIRFGFYGVIEDALDNQLQKFGVIFLCKLEQKLCQSNLWVIFQTMHGRLKVKTSAQKEAERKKEEQVKLAKYLGAREKLFSLRSSLDQEVLGILTQLLIFNCECSTYWNIRKEFVLRKLSQLKGQIDDVKGHSEEVEDQSDVVKVQSDDEIQGQTERSIGDPGDTNDEELDKFFLQELIFTVQCLRKNPKAYAVWLYREFIMKNNPKADWNTELILCDEFLKEDERNFHCWDYRRIVIKNVPTRDTVEYFLLIPFFVSFQFC